MPIYEYECLECGKNFEANQSIKDKHLKSCKFCEGSVRRLISQSSFALKGGGWYKDGYGNKGATKTKGSKGTSDKKPESKAPGKSPAKKEANKNAS